MAESLHEEATVGFACLGPRRWIHRPRGTDRWHGPSCARQAREPTHEGFAEPGSGAPPREDMDDSGPIGTDQGFAQDPAEDRRASLGPSLAAQAGARPSVVAAHTPGGSSPHPPRLPGGSGVCSDQRT